MIIGSESQFGLKSIRQRVFTFERVIISLLLWSCQQSHTISDRATILLAANYIIGL